MIYIAVLLTCHDRKTKTVSSLDSLYDSLDTYNNAHGEEKDKISLATFLTDDGCTDGTSAEVTAKFPEREINIVRGDGSLFWAKGMIAAWECAMKYSKDWDFYLLINDDTIMMSNLFYELMSTHKYSVSNYGMGGIYSGVTCSINDPTEMTYGGDLWVDGSYSKTRRLTPTGIPQRCNMTNANIFMVEKSVIDKIGIFYPYKHGGADNDYSIQASKKGIPILITGNFCGKCDFDHASGDDLRNKLANMSFKERLSYFSNPIHSIKDKLVFTRRNMPRRLPFVFFGRMMDVLCPSIYTYFHKRIDKKRV